MPRAKAKAKAKATPVPRAPDPEPVETVPKPEAIETPVEAVEDRSIQLLAWIDPVEAEEARRLAEETGAAVDAARNGGISGDTCLRVMGLESVIVAVLGNWEDAGIVDQAKRNKGKRHIFATD